MDDGTNRRQPLKAQSPLSDQERQDNLDDLNPPPRDVVLTRRTPESRAKYWEEQFHIEFHRNVQLRAELAAALAELERVKMAALTLCSLPEDVADDIRDWRRRELLYALTDDPAVLAAEPAAGGGDV